MQISDEQLQSSGIGGVGEGSQQAAVTPEPVKEKDIFEIKIGAVDQKAKIKVIKEVRGITGLGLKEVSNSFYRTALMAVGSIAIFYRPKN